MIIRVLRNSGAIQLMDIEEYVKGVVPSEMPASWAMEGLKAQAIAARTYALWQRSIAPAARNWDIGCTTSYQVYTDYRHPRANQAVDETIGITGGTKDTALIRATYFSASCGGHTLNNWGPTWLKSTACPCGRGVYGHRNGLCQWGAKALAERGYTCFQILDFYYNLGWWGDYLALGRVQYDPNPVNPWPDGTIIPVPPPEPEPPPVEPPYVIGGEGFFVEVAHVIHWLAVKTVLVAFAIASIPLLGKALAPPLQEVATTLQHFEIAITEFAVTYQDILDIIVSVLDGTLLASWITALFADWEEFRHNPEGWVHDKIDSFWPELGVILEDPGGWLEDRLTLRFPELAAMIGDTSSWLLNKLYVLWPDGYWLILEPGPTIRKWFVGEFPNLYYFVDDPYDWVKRNVAYMFGGGVNLFEDIDKWVVYWLQKALLDYRDEYKGWLRDRIESFVRYLWEGEL